MNIVLEVKLYSMLKRKWLCRTRWANRRWFYSNTTDQVCIGNPMETKGRRVFKCWSWASGKVLGDISWQVDQQNVSTTLSYSWICKWFSLWLSYLCLLIDLTQRKSKCSPIFITGSSFTNWSTALSKAEFRLIPSYKRPGNRNSIFFDDNISKVWLPVPWKRQFWVDKLARGFWKDFHLRGTKRELKITNFVKWML